MIYYEYKIMEHIIYIILLVKFEEEFQIAIGMREPSFSFVRRRILFLENLVCYLISMTGDTCFDLLSIFLYWSDIMKHQELLKKIIPELRVDNSITAVMLMGSVAAETENENSDLNLFILGSKSKLQSDIVDNIMVEYLYVTPEVAQSKLDKTGTEVYHYLGSKIIYDLDGKLIKLMRSAMNKYKKYKTNDKEKIELRHWLYSAKSKINSAISQQDVLKTDYITAAATEKIIEAVFAINDVPYPPISRMLYEVPNLRHIPDPEWFDNLFNKNTSRRTETIMSSIDWALDLL